MNEKLYSVFKIKNDLGDNDLLFNQKGYIKAKTPFESLNLFILHFPERTYHFLPLGLNILEYHEGKEFTEFLKANGVNCAEYDILEAIDEKKGLYAQRNGSSMQLKMNWIETGYQYTISDSGNIQPTIEFSVGKSGKIKIEHEKSPIEIEFVHQGPKNDPVIIEAFKEVKKSKKNDKVRGCITVIIMLFLFFLLGKVWTWIFGEPDDSFNNLLVPLFELV